MSDKTMPVIDIEKIKEEIAFVNSELDKLEERSKNIEFLKVEKLNAIAAYLDAMSKCRTWSTIVSDKAEDLIKSF